LNMLFIADRIICNSDYISKSFYMFNHDEWPGVSYWKRFGQTRLLAVIH